MTQKELFLEVWEESRHVCSVCDKELGEVPKAYFFSHLLGKGAYPKFKLLKKNIRLMCFKCHQDWDFGLKSDKKFDETRRLEQELKESYFNG